MTKTFKSNAAKAKQFFADKMAFTTGPVEISHRIEKKEDVVIIDVREAKDFKKGHVPGAINLPQEKWRTLAGLRRNTMNIVYCYAQNCHMGAHAAMQFAAKGYSVMEMDGGFESWKENGLKNCKIATRISASGKTSCSHENIIPRSYAFVFVCWRRILPGRSRRRPDWPDSVELPWPPSHGRFPHAEQATCCDVFTRPAVGPA